MKKWMAVLLVLALTMSLSACRCSKETDAPAETDPTTDSTNATNPTQPVSDNAVSGTMEENINKIVAENPVEFMGGVAPLDLTDTSEEGLWALKSYTGLDSAAKLTDGAVYEPMTGSQAFSLVLVRVKNSADAKAVARQMKDNIDPRKWICAQADDIKVAGYGDVVMFIMLDSQLGKTAQSYVDAFQKICGGKLDFTL